jgi:hypothetical protein
VNTWCLINCIIRVANAHFGYLGGVVAYTCQAKPCHQGNDDVTVPVPIKHASDESAPRVSEYLKSLGFIELVILSDQEQALLAHRDAVEALCRHHDIRLVREESPVRQRAR